MVSSIQLDPSPSLELRPYQICFPKCTIRLSRLVDGRASVSRNKPTKMNQGSTHPGMLRNEGGLVLSGQYYIRRVTVWPGHTSEKASVVGLRRRVARDVEEGSR